MTIAPVGRLLVLAGVLLAGVLLAPLPLVGQTFDPSDAAGQRIRSRPEMWRDLGAKCAAETARFCPASAEQTPRDQALCLKFYKTSLSLGCRGAVNAVTH